MAAPYGNNNGKKFTSENASEMARRKKGVKHKRTLLKEKILNWDEAREILERNIIEALQSKNNKERLLATRYFAEYFIPKKRDLKEEMKVRFEDWLREAYGSEDNKQS